MKKTLSLLAALLIVTANYSTCAFATNNSSSVTETIMTASWSEHYNSQADMYKNSDIVVTGTVEYSYTELRYDLVFTHNIISINEVSKGNSEFINIDVVQTGGAYGDLYTPSPSEISLLDGESEYALYLKYSGDETFGDYYTILGGYQGVGIIENNTIRAITNANLDMFTELSSSVSVNATTPAADHGCIWAYSSLNCYIDSSVSSYGSNIKSAASTGAKAWNSTQAPTVSIGATGSSSEIGINMANYGSIGWNGNTVTHYSNGEILGAEIRLNASGLEDYFSDSGLWQAITCHEMGHALGLGHNTSSSSSVMHPYTTDYYNYAGSSPKIKTPQSADRTGMNNIYG